MTFSMQIHFVDSSLVRVSYGFGGAPQAKKKKKLGLAYTKYTLDPYPSLQHDRTGNMTDQVTCLQHGEGTLWTSSPDP